jgi:hypothetical protein
LVNRPPGAMRGEARSHLWSFRSLR